MNVRVPVVVIVNLPRKKRTFEIDTMVVSLISDLPRAEKTVILDGVQSTIKSYPEEK